MIVQRPSASRGRGPAAADWLDSRHSFSFGQYYDPHWMGFGALRVINEDRVAPGAGFAPHRHANMEILSYVLAGRLAHRDSSGAEGVIGPGELQWMSAGHGVEHSEYNASATEAVHFLQVWIQPDQVNATPAYAHRPASDAPGWQLLASPDGSAGSLAIRQDARLYRLATGPGEEAAFDLDPEQRYWLHVAAGEIVSGGEVLRTGDAVGLVDEEGALALAGGRGGGEVLLFELPGANAR
ncbi:pirin family protein [Lysobacter sp. GX 14042]|uniref:pirin family protein n=1 Tax=Lysobacter sp. GX 14042 TaxID=2907155 RepID=UPI001F270818|nr:pirin family protein [Lysobacter sp. GX 14042]MCE7033393.1 pirin family protein [Lysobacter sp. GX 14042]